VNRAARREGGENHSNSFKENSVKGFLFVLVLIVAGVVGLGFYRGWFSVMWESGDGKAHITGTVNEDKFKEDVQKVKDVGHHEKDQVEGSAASKDQK
jgi:hypothetical protein